MGKKSVRISQCMIVKNEEEQIEKALSWGKGIVWEQIVVDTGSADRTAELAEAMGAKVYSFPWIDDFAAAKNFAISKAQGEWIVFLDADEVFAPGDGGKLLDLLEQLSMQGKKMDGIWTAWMQLDEAGEIFGAGSQIRVFRNLPGLKYRRRIHEQLAWEDGHPMQTYDATQSLSVLHSGYQGKKWEEKKQSRRNNPLILKELEEHPGDYEMMGYLGDDYYSMGEYEEAARWYQKSINAMPERLDSRDQRSAVTFMRLMKILGDRQDTQTRLEEVYHKGAALLPEEPDLDYGYGICLAQKNRFGEAKACLEQAFRKLEQFGSYNRALELGGNLTKAYEDLAWCCLMTGETNRAVELCAAVLKADPGAMRALVILLKGFRGTGEQPVVSTEAVVGVLKKLLDFNGLSNRYRIWRASREAGYRELARYMETFFSPEETAELKKAGLL